MNRRVGGLAALLVAGVLTLGTAACARSSLGAPTGNEPGADIIVGASLDLSGPAATVGLAQERALQIAAEMINVRGFEVNGTTRRVQLIVRDNAGAPETAAITMSTLVTVDHAVAVIAGGTPTSVAMAPIAESLHVPMLSLVSADGVTLPFAERRYAFTLAPKASDVAAQMFRHLSATTGVRRIALLASTGPHGDAGVSAVQVAANSAGLALDVVARFTPGGADLPAQAQQVASHEPDVVLVWSDGDSAESISARLRAAGHDGRIIFDPGAASQVAIATPDATVVDGDEMIHPAVLSGAQVAITTPSELRQQRFVDRYVQLHQTLPGYAPYAADAVGLIAEAASRAGGVDGHRLRDALEAGPYEGIAGAYMFSAISHNGLEPDALVVFTARHGTWIRTS